MSGAIKCLECILHIKLPSLSNPAVDEKRMMPVRYMLSSCVCPSVGLSVTSRHCTRMAKRRITQTTSYDSPGTLVFWRQKSRRNSNGITPTGAPNRGGVGSSRRFSTNISLCLRNGARQRHSCYGMLIGTRICSIDWCYFQWPWVTLTTQNHPILWRLYRYQVSDGNMSNCCTGRSGLCYSRFCCTPHDAMLTMTNWP